jgi:hypothetical protein
MMKLYNTILYICNSILFIFGIVIISYSIDNITNNILNCENLYYLSVAMIINSIICIVSVEDLKLLGMITTIILFTYNIYNIITINCNLEKSIYINYILSIINNGITIIVYIMNFIKEHPDKPDKLITNLIHVDYGTTLL